MEDDNIIKLLFNNSKKYIFNAVNWGYSKGDTYDNICVILTNDFNDIDNDSFVVEQNKIITINKLYVALSRTKGNLYIIKKCDFDKVQGDYIKLVK